MSNMVERVARAIDPVAWSWIDKTRIADPTHIVLQRTVDAQLAAARRAIDEMRGPSPEMKAAGAAVPSRFGGGKETYVSDVFDEMIHEALK